jgi:hypothetical protein
MPEGLDEMRRLAVADQPRHVGHCERLMGEQLGGVTQPHGSQLGSERRQADLVVGPLELAWRDSECTSECRESERSAVATLEGNLGADVQLGHELHRGFAMCWGPCSTLMRCHRVLSDSVVHAGRWQRLRKVAR